MLNDPLPELKDMLERLAQLRSADRFDAAGNATFSLGEFVESECPALIAELEQLREVVRRSNRVVIDDHLTIDRRDCGPCFVYLDGMEVNCRQQREILPHDSLLEALAYLRSPAGVAAVASVRGEGEA